MRQPLSRTALKRAVIAGAVSLTATLGLVAPAHADNGVVNIRGKESFNTDTLLNSLCNGDTGTTYWFINVQTGQLTADSGHGLPPKDLPPPIEMFQGHCSYPKSSSWTWTGSESRVSNTLVNCSSGSQLSQQLQMNGSTTSTTTSSVKVGGGIKWSALEKVLEFNAGAEYTKSWSYAKASGWSTTTGITVPPKRVGWLALRPEMRTVRSNPFFHIDSYSWGDGHGHVTRSNSWRGRGYSNINSQGAYYDAVGNVLDGQGKPAGQYVARDRAVTSSDRC
ncbi:hypothetical protein [Streptomyces sp. VNUA24]|uniref:hypothetical protein n=1 Tax=Streptomyces sp. VNUA24 TaxID=3031131 RepID=UPI0023B79816|nr:hypothetical protein [Streptomyces sp. VNUA24]WEH13029.1 hypothetical protein PYR72_04645 [Streptomyces sp. VNUA24]